jgi:serine/threonine protein kinase/formylglycine-generating enzyme required for sulfatase activity
MMASDSYTTRPVEETWAAQKDRLCDQFEAAWRNGERPKIEDYLCDLVEPKRSDLLAHLLEVELELRRANGEKPTPEDYEQRFRQEVALIRAAFRDAGPLAPEWIDRYKVIRDLGGGGFGHVYLCYDDNLRRHVAIKVPRRDRFSSAQAKEFFLQEARNVAGLHHEAIVTLYEFGETEGLCYLAYEYIVGCNLAERLKQGPVPQHQAASMIGRIADALHYAHGENVYHRDIKPANILLDKRNRPHLTDFGLAVRVQDLDGERGRRAGTDRYMAPEQVRGEGDQIDGRADIYSLGVVLYELLTGRRPFDGRKREDVYDQILSSREPRPPREINHAIHPELQDICLKAMAKSVSARYLTAGDLAEKLHRAAALVAPPEAAVTASSSLPASVPVPQPSSAPPPAPVLPKGLRSFGPEDSAFFLELLPGPRDRDRLPESIRFWKIRVESTDTEMAFPVGLIYGPSGCGKSSLIKAGLLPQLAPTVLPVYVEATRENLEDRLLMQLRKRCPDLGPRASLRTTIARLRQNRGLPPGSKLLLVLDQFEQWLHAHAHDMESTELVAALRQADGAHVQVLLMVRSDFWMSISRLFTSLKINLDRSNNSRAVDLFGEGHAHHVLHLFGHAYGQLSAEQTDMTKAQTDFLALAVKELSGDGDVIPVRLSLFADMMKKRPWTPDEFAKVGGVKGVGVKFLEDIFTQPDLKARKDAAQALLQVLLPAPAANIKGRMHSRRELAAECGLPEESHTFAQLIENLTREYIITPTEPSIPNPVSSTQSPDHAADVPQAMYYQLTHDYLVPSLREWLTEEKRKTWKGRAELRLAERAALWEVQPQNRLLPAWWEWANIRLGTRPRTWTPTQRRMMRKAGRYHAKRGLLLMVLLLAATSGGLVAYLETSRANHAAGLVRLLETADIAQVPAIVEELEPYRYWANARLEEANNKAAPESRQKLNTSIALLPLQPGQAEHLYGRLLDAELDFGQLLDPKPNVVRVILAFIAKHPPQGEHRDRILMRLGAEVGASPPPNAEEDVKEKVAKRQAKAAVALLRMNQPEEVWPLLKHSADPRARSYLIHLLGPSGVDFKVLRQQLKDQSDVTIRRALLLSLGDFGEEDIAAGERDSLVNYLYERYSNDPDPGIHGAVEWLLRQWKQDQWLKQTDEKWANEKQRREQRLDFILRGFANGGPQQPVPQWYVNSQGQTMVVIPSSMEFMMGSPPTEDGRWDDERPQQRQSVGHHFALAAKPVTVDQFRRFPKNHDPESSRRRPKPDCPVTMLSWYTAAEYCNWLSDQEGLERCYEPNEEGNFDAGMKQAPNFLNRTGYRLPTEEEWECACRAGAVTSRYYGESVELLRKYGWYVENSGNRSWNVSTLKPNDWGLFGMHGNVWSWCQDRYEPSKMEKRIFRGGSYVDAADDVRAARRLKTDPGTPTRYVGLRPARTLR